jgi:hypothetical protein
MMSKPKKSEEEVLDQFTDDKCFKNDPTTYFGAIYIILVLPVH